MIDPRPVELPYPGDSADLFICLLHLPWPVFLDSGHPYYPESRYDILAAAPRATLVTQGKVTRMKGPDGARWSFDDPFALLRRALQLRGSVPGNLPFSGGAIGYFAYDLGRRIERLPARAAADIRVPEMAVGIYDWAVVVDHHDRQAWLVGEYPDEVPHLLGSPATSPSGNYAVRSPVIADMDEEAYGRAFARIQAYIRDGDCYQVNLARRFAVTVEGQPWAIYRALRRACPAPYGAFFGTPYGSVLSNSPERFLQVKDGLVQTRPIKGTRRRSADPDEDRALAQALAASPKDRAENIMIVDLLRNDLGKTCAVGSVAVPRLLEVESFPNVHHLVSTVTGRLAPGRHATDLLRGCFPGGSITGAPKLRAMEIIEELEPYRRGIYCGAIGYVGNDGSMDTSIAIRTLFHHQNSVHFWAGGGIVADSDPKAEFQEILDKAQAMLDVLGATRRTHGTYSADRAGRALP